LTLGILIISWDEFEGGFVSYKYPEGLEVPENLIQLLQISHTFNPGAITLQEKEFHALSIGNEVLQKVIVLILEEFEDASDFNEIIENMSAAVSKFQEDSELHNELRHLYNLSQSVFKAREAVLTKLANEVTELKNHEIDINQSLEWLIQNEDDFQKKLIFLLLRYGDLSFTEIKQYIPGIDFNFYQMLEEMEAQKFLDISDQKCRLILHYLL